MSATLTCQTSACSTLPERENRSFLARLASAIAREFRVRRDMRLLSSFDEAALHDIGLVRGGMEDAVRHGRSRQQVVPAPEQAHHFEVNGTSLPHSLVEWR